MTDPDKQKAAEALLDRWWEGEGRGMSAEEWVGLGPRPYVRWRVTGKLPPGYEPPDRPLDPESVPPLPSEDFPWLLMAILGAILLVMAIYGIVSYFEGAN